MGNQLTNLGQIYPVEYYLANYNDDINLEASLGSTRFMKVARVRHKDYGQCVAKIYAINDQSIPIQEHKQKIERIRDSLGSPSALPFLSCIVDDKCAILSRQFIKYNLYDRLSTRPFLTSIEKRWIAYQLLRCIQSIHKQSIHHGDIKSENILVTSFLWVTLADFASYKPVVIPANNPSEFSYFFDTSRRHCCNVAPERFVFNQAGETPESPSQLTAQMDLFSLGCVFAELFSEDTPNSSIFDLGQILMFKRGQYDPMKFVEDGISDPRIRRLILNLIDLEPNKRYSATYHSEQLVPSLFPAYFHTLYDYFCKLVPLEPYAKILILERDLDKLMKEIITEDEHGLLIPLLLATSCLRSLESTDARLIGLGLCVRLIESSPVMTEYVTDRLLPYIIQLLENSESRVKARCVSSLNRILKRVNNLSSDEANLFIDYILPSLSPLVDDHSTLVRIAVASNIAELAKTASRLIDSETLLQEAFGAIVSRILTDSNGHVRCAVDIDCRIQTKSASSGPNLNIRRQDVSTISGLNLADGGSSLYADSPLLMSSSVSGMMRTTRPRGVLLAHLYEHKGPVNKLVVMPGTSQFISCSSDATIKFWDCAGVSTKPQVLFRSMQTFVSPDAGAFTTISACMGTDTLLALTECNNLHLLQLHTPSSHSRLIKTVNSGPELVTDLITLSPYTYATCSTSSIIRGYDLRLPTKTDIWNLQMDGSAGLITCMDGNECCLACGTSSSVISLFDLRFYIRATSMSYPLFQEKMKKRIRRVVVANDEIYCSIDGNNEVSTWDCESASRTKTLWASPYPCLSSRHSSHHSVLSMIVDGNKDMNSVITAGDDMKIRFWDLTNPSRSYMVSRPPYNSYHKLSGVSNSESGSVDPIYYQTKLVDGIQVIQETEKLPVSSTTTAPTVASSSTSSSSSSQLAMAASSAHRDSISCLATVNQSSLLLSASRDGVIKIWR